MTEEHGERITTSVFVSYAHENPAFRGEVRRLCDWLRTRGATVVCDFDHAFKPPPLGWAAWMQQGIEDAGVVLIVASPKYKARFEKRASPETGRGVAWEGAIITQDLYGSALRNDRFFPILPDGGSHDDVPTALRPWDNGHRFPSGHDGILELIRQCGTGVAQIGQPVGRNATSDAVRNATPLPTVQGKALLELTVRATSALDDPQARPFCAALARTIGSHEDIDTQCLIQELDALQPLKVQLFGIEGAVTSVKFSGSEHPIELAASCLYLRAAIAAVNLDAALAIGLPTDALMVVPQKSDVVIAILVAALQGEVRDIRLDAPQSDENANVQHHLRSEGLIDLDSIPFDPLRTHEAIETEAALQMDKLGAILYKGKWTLDRPTDPDALDDWHQRIRDAAERSRHVAHKHFRFVVTRDASALLDDDATCEALYRRLSIPFTRVDPDALQPQEVERLLGVSASTIENLFGDFLVSLASARQPVAATKEPANVVDLLHTMLALIRDNQTNTDELKALALKLEASKADLKRSTIQEVIDTVDKGRKLGEGADKHAEFCRKVYSLGQSILANLPQ